MSPVAMPFVAVVSSNRSRNVPIMEEHLRGVPHTWVVPDGQSGDYEYTGAGTVVEVAGGLVPQLNWIIDEARERGKFALSMDDDLKRLEFVQPGAGKARPLTMLDAIELLVKANTVNGTYLSGIAPTNNAYFTRQMFSLNGFIRSAMFCVNTQSGLRMDPRFLVKQDYDYTMQHLTAHGSVARVDSILGTFDYTHQSGGCQDYRTPEVEEAAIALLLEKWPDNISRNTRKPGEVRLRWRGKMVDDEAPAPGQAGMFG